MSTTVTSLDKQAVLDAQKADETAAGIPKLEGVNGGDGPWPGPQWTLHESDVLQSKDGTYGYEPAVMPKTAPAKCVITEKSDAKWRDAVAVKVGAVAEEKPIDEGADMAPN